MATEKSKAAKESIESMLSQKVANPEDFPFLAELSLSPEQMAKLTNDDIFWAQLVHKALKGDIKATQEILDRRYGKAPQHITQDIRTFTYTDFINEINEREAQELQSDPVVIDLPQIETQELTGDGGSPDNSLLDDLGLL